MKRIIMTFVAMLLVSMGAFAQNSIKGDVNNDGKVDVADVVAVIDIIMKGGGQGSGSNVYYWYASQVDPRTVAEADAVIVTDPNAAGWRLVADPDTYVFDMTSSDKAIHENPIAWASWYIALPADKTVFMYDFVGAPINWEHDFTITFKGITYNVWEWDKSEYFGAWIVRK